MTKKKEGDLIDKSEYFTNLKKAVEARNAFLEEHPELKPFQKIIEKELKKAGSIENKMAVLKMMMDDKLSHQKTLLLRLKELVEKKEKK